MKPTCVRPDGCNSGMLCTSIEACGEYQNVQEERAREAYTALLPSCCEDARSGRLVVPYLEEGQDEPRWTIPRSDYLRRLFGDLTERASAHFCPGCGSKLPRFERKIEHPEPLCVVDKSECYCVTCGDRLPCSCYPTLALWKVNLDEGE